MDKKKKITWIAVFILLTVVTLYFVKMCIRDRQRAALWKSFGDGV